MHREVDRQTSRPLLDCLYQRAERDGIVDIARTVQRQHDILPVATDRPEAADKRMQRIDHGIADQMNLLRAHSLAQETLTSTLLCHEEQIGDRIGDYPVDLLRHAPVVAAQPCLDMRDRDAELLCDDRRGNG